MCDWRGTWAHQQGPEPVRRIITRITALCLLDVSFLKLDPCWYLICSAARVHRIAGDPVPKVCIAPGRKQGCQLRDTVDTNRWQADVLSFAFLAGLLQIGAPPTTRIFHERAPSLTTDV